MNLPVYTLFSSMGAFSWNFAWLWATWQGSKTTAYHSWRKRQPELADRHADWLGLAFASLTVVMGAWHRYKNNRDSSEEDVNDNVDNHSEQQAK